MFLCDVNSETQNAYLYNYKSLDTIENQKDSLYILPLEFLHAMIYESNFRRQKQKIKNTCNILLLIIFVSV